MIRKLSLLVLLGVAGCNTTVSTNPVPALPHSRFVVVYQSANLITVMNTETGEIWTDAGGDWKRLRGAVPTTWP